MQNLQNLQKSHKVLGFLKHWFVYLNFPKAILLLYEYHFRKQHHDVIVFQVLDPMELDLTYKKGCLFEDLETGETLAADPRGLARDYERVFGEFLDRYRQSCAQMQIDYRLVCTDQSVETFVRAYLQERRRLSK